MADSVDPDKAARWFARHATEIAALRAQLAEALAERDKAIRASGYDWDLLTATQQSLQEHMAEVARLREAISEAIKNAAPYGNGGHIAQLLRAALQGEG